MSLRSIYISGIDKMISDMERRAQALNTEAVRTIEYIVRELANYAKSTGTYQDQTGALRNSIAGAVTEVTQDYVNGEIRAPQEYAQAVEARGYKVISHIVLERFEWITKVLDEKLSVFK